MIMVMLNYVMICFIFGTTFLAIKVGIEAGADPLLSAGLRFFLAGFLVVLYFAFRKKLVLSLFWSKQLILISFCLTAMTFATLYWAEQYITSGLAAVLSAFGPVMVFLLHIRQSKEKMNAQQAAGLLLGMIGVLLISSPSLDQGVSIYWIPATAAVIFGQWFYSVGAVKSKSFLKEKPDISPFLINGIQMTIGGVLLLMFSAVWERPSFTSLALADVQVSLLYLIFIGSIAGHGLFYWLVNKTNPFFPSTWLYVSPVIAVSLGAVLLDEHITTSTAIGAVSVIIGVFLVNKQTLMKAWKEGILLRKVE